MANHNATVKDTVEAVTESVQEGILEIPEMNEDGDLTKKGLKQLQALIRASVETYFDNTVWYVTNHGRTALGPFASVYPTYRPARKNAQVRNPSTGETVTKNLPEKSGVKVSTSKVWRDQHGDALLKVSRQAAKAKAAKSKG